MSTYGIMQTGRGSAMVVLTLTVPSVHLADRVGASLPSQKCPRQLSNGTLHVLSANSFSERVVEAPAEGITAQGLTDDDGGTGDAAINRKAYIRTRNKSANHTTPPFITSNAPSPPTEHCRLSSSRPPPSTESREAHQSVRLFGTHQTATARRIRRQNGHSRTVPA